MLTQKMPVYFRTIIDADEDDNEHGDSSFIMQQFCDHEWKICARIALRFAHLYANFCHFRSQMHGNWLNERSNGLFNHMRQCILQIVGTVFLDFSIQKEKKSKQKHTNITFPWISNCELRLCAPFIPCICCCRLSALIFRFVAIIVLSGVVWTPYNELGRVSVCLRRILLIGICLQESRTRTQLVQIE